MPIYNCEYCDFKTSQIANYERHLKTIKHKKMVENITTLSIRNPHPEFSCKYCGQVYKHKSSIYKHIKYNCTQNKDEDLKELVRLLNLQLDQKEQEMEMQRKQIECQTKQIDKLMNKLEIHGSFNTTNNIQNNIQLLAYKDTDLSHLTEKDYMFCIKKVNFCVKNLIEKIHFNPDKPENMNIYISNLKDKYLMMYENGNWNIKHKSELDSLYQEKEMLLEEWINEEQDKYPELKEKFIKYLNNKENDETLNMIKEEIKIMMYNNKKVLKLT
jgi:ElaB/YqjD/DUF883 family membrane-anchored ribosome-binding protein